MNTGSSTLPLFQSLDVVNGRWVLTLSNGAKLDRGSATGTAGSAGPVGVGITHTDVVAGNLQVTYSDGRVVNAGHVLGEPGTAGAAGRGIVAAEVVGGRLKLTYSDNTVTDLGSIQGPAGVAGRGIASSVIQGGRLVIGYTDGTFTDAGYVMGATGAAGRGISSTTITGGHLIITYTDGSTEDKGQVVGASGAAGAAYAGNPTLIGLARIVVWSTDSANLVGTYRVLYPAAGRTYTWSLVGLSVANSLAISAAGDLSTVAAGFNGVAAEGTITVTVRATDDQGATLDQAVTIVRRVAAAGGANVATLRRVYVSSVEVTSSNNNFNFAAIIPAGATEVDLEAVGGGASGFCGRYDTANGIYVGGHGGAAGAVKRRTVRVVDVPSTLALTVGAGGAATRTNSTYCFGNAGQATQIGGLVYAPGGLTGVYYTQAEKMAINLSIFRPPSDLDIGHPGYVQVPANYATQKYSTPAIGPSCGGAGGDPTHPGSGGGGTAGIGRPDAQTAGGYPDIGGGVARGGYDAVNVWSYGSGGTGGVQYDRSTFQFSASAGGNPGGGGGGGMVTTQMDLGYATVSGGGGRGAIRMHFYRYEAP